MFLLVIVLMMGAGCNSDSGPQLYGGFDGSIDSLKLDLSSNRPAFWPSQDDELAGIDRTKSPRLNGEKSSNKVIGSDERKFLLIRESEAANDFTRTIDISNGKSYEGYVFFSNDSPADSASGNGADLTSRDTRLALKIPKSVRTRTSLSAMLISSNGQPATAGSTAVLKSADASDTLNLTLVSAELHGQDGKDWGALANADLTSPQGALIGCNGTKDGVVPPGCSGYITFKLESSKSTFEAKFTVGFDSGDHYQNYLTVGDDRSIWVRFSYVNTGKVDQKNVNVQISIKSAAYDFAVIKNSPQETDARNYNYMFPLDQLKAGQPAGNVPVGKEVSIIAMISLQNDGLKTLCNDKQADIQGQISVEGFYSFTTIASIYPDLSKC